MFNCVLEFGFLISSSFTSQLIMSPKVPFLCLLKLLPSAQLIKNLYCIYTRLTRIINNHWTSISGSYPRKKSSKFSSMWYHQNNKLILSTFYTLGLKSEVVVWYFFLYENHNNYLFVSFNIRNNLTNVHVSPCQREKFLFISNYKLSSNWHLN